MKNKIGIIYKEEDALIAGTAKQLVKELAADYQVLLDEKKFKNLLVFNYTWR